MERTTCPTCVFGSTPKLAETPLRLIKIRKFQGRTHYFPVRIPDATGTQGHKKKTFCALVFLILSVRTSSLFFEHKTAESRIRDAVLPDFNVTGKSIIKRVSSHRDDPVVPAKSLIQHGLDFKGLSGLEKPLRRVASVGILYADFGSTGSYIGDFQIGCTVTLLQVFGGHSKSSCA